MRLRSTQFVFMLLLVCSVQHREHLALHLLAGGVPGQTTSKAQQQETSQAQSPRRPASSRSAQPKILELSLEQADHAALRQVWSMPRAVRESAAVSSFTGFLRA